MTELQTVYCLIDAYAYEKLHFAANDLPRMNEYINKTLLKRAQDYECEGCTWCCYGRPEAAQWCTKEGGSYERTLGYYLRMLFECAFEGCDMSIKKTSYRPSDSGVGYVAEKDVVWTLTRDYNMTLTLIE